MKKLILLFTVLLLVSCGNKDEKAIQEHYKSVLKDPESFQVHSMELLSTEDDGLTKLYKLDYGAKNSFGGMVRDTDRVTIIGDKVYKTEKYSDITGTTE